MAKVTNYIPEPKSEYDVENQRQILESLTTGFKKRTRRF